MARFLRAPAFRGVFALVLAAASLSLDRQAIAQNGGASGSGGVQDYPIPASAAEAFSPIREGFANPMEPRDDLRGPAPYADDRESRLKAARHCDRSPSRFFCDTELTLYNRTYWFEEDSFGTEAKALTSGGHVSYQSGFVADFLQLRGALYTTQPLYASEDAGDTLNLSADGDQITTLGQAHALLKFSGQELTVGRQLVRTPFINPYDDRMIPLTFEGVVLLPEWREQRRFEYIASYLWRYKPRNSAAFIPLSAGLGVDQDEGVLINGIHYGTARFNAGVVNYWIKDTLNTAYGELDYLLPTGGGAGAPSFRIGANYLDQASVGADLIPGAPFETYQASARLVASYRNFVVTGAMSRVGRGAAISNPFGYDPSYTSMFISSFQRADERGYLASLSYDFARVGLEGWKFFAAFGRGLGAVSAPAGTPEPDRNEIDLRLVYEPRRGPLEGLQVQLEYIDERMIEESPNDSLKQLRVVVNYMLPLL